jgi:L-histidine N-alpha-methyltransferase
MAERPRSIPPKHFYDDVGSALFDRICELPEYYLTRAEHRLLERHASEIVVAAGTSEALIELGSGMARKTGLLLDAMLERVPSPLYVALDISPEALDASARALLENRLTLRVRAVVGDFQYDLGRAAKAAAHMAGPRLFAFLGSTIGNLDEHEAPALMRAIAREMRPEDAFLLGTDLVKDVHVLHAAYNDRAGVTARFNKNMLTVLNREMGANFDPDQWDHEASYNTRHARIEMHLRAKSSNMVTIEELGLAVRFAEGERILTEISRKFTRRSVEEMLEAGGLRLVRWFSGDDGAFALALAKRR